MVLLRRLILCFLLMITGVVWSDTFILSTQVHTSPVHMNPEERAEILGIESGIMETLFDNGHIFSNMYNTPDKDGHDFPLKHLMNLAKETGADYLLEVIPDESGATWNLYKTGDVGMGKRAYEDIIQVSDNMNNEKRWVVLGQILGQHIMDYLHGH